MTTINYGVQAVPETSSDEKDHRRQIAHAVNLLIQGKANITVDVTLVANSAVTTLTDARISAFSAVVPAMAMTANAAADVAAGVYVTNLSSGVPGAGIPGSCTINHRNNAAVDRTIRFLILG